MRLAVLLAALVAGGVACADGEDAPGPVGGPASDAGADQSVAPAADAGADADGGHVSVSWLDDPNEGFSGGAATVFDFGRTAFSQAVPGLSPAHEEEFFVGNAIFNRGWVIAPASVKDMDGLGPLFNATNCSGCHLRDGRGRPPLLPDEAFLSMLLRLSIPGSDEHGGPRPEPSYGDQLQEQAIPGVPVEGRGRVAYDEVPGQYADGTGFSLRRPRYSIEGLAGPPLAAEVLLSPRVAPHMSGLGLLEAVPAEAIMALADPDDRDGDGISGRPNLVWDVASARKTLGRFGWKANQPSLLQQTAGAFNGDIGITSMLFPGESCVGAQSACQAAPTGEPGPQLRDSFLKSVAAYSSSLAVPARRHLDDPKVQQGKYIFARTGCASCHTPVLRTGQHPDLPELSPQKIRPFTDLLLHDMGPELADGRPDFEATGSEWRTPPLWGLGLVPVVNRHNLLLHDGRARGFAEAILWHGGEALRSREGFRQLPQSERDALVAFLESL